MVAQIDVEDTIAEAFGQTFHSDEDGPSAANRW
jgi:hypothetical protein